MPIPRAIAELPTPLFAYDATELARLASLTYDAAQLRRALVHALGGHPFADSDLLQIQQQERTREGSAMVTRGAVLGWMLMTGSARKQLPPYQLAGAAMGIPRLAIPARNALMDLRLDLLNSGGRRAFDNLQAASAQVLDKAGLPVSTFNASARRLTGFQDQPPEAVMEYGAAIIGATLYELYRLGPSIDSTQG